MTDQEVLGPGERSALVDFDEPDLGTLGMENKILVLIKTTVVRVPFKLQEHFGIQNAEKIKQIIVLCLTTESRCSWCKYYKVCMK